MSYHVLCQCRRASRLSGVRYFFFFFKHQINTQYLILCLIGRNSLPSSSN